MKRILTILTFCFVMSNMFAQSCPDSNHPHAIDLGIGVKFACCNMGASSPEKYGDHFAWGETDKKSRFTTLNYEYGGNNNYKAYHEIGKDISGTQYDVAHVKWQGNWRMPTKEEMELLKDRCKKEWVTYKRVEGMRFIGPNGNSIFMPAAGSSWYDSYFNYVGYSGHYWSSTYSKETSNLYSDAYILGFDCESIGLYPVDRAGGSYIRPVTE